MSRHMDCGVLLVQTSSIRTKCGAEHKRRVARNCQFDIPQKDQADGALPPLECLISAGGFTITTDAARHHGALRSTNGVVRVHSELGNEGGPSGVLPVDRQAPLCMEEGGTATRVING